MISRSPVVWFAFVCLFAAKAGAGQFTLVGVIPASCPITVKTQNEQMPFGFRITPAEAAKIASDHSWVKCNSIFQQQVYTDFENYYIVKSALGPMTRDSIAVVVNGQSGEVSELNSPDFLPLSVKESLRRFLQTLEGGKDMTMRYVPAFRDLNSDGIPEAIVYLKFSRWCGSGGCNLLILKQEGSSWRILSNITNAQLPIRVLTNTTNGRHDIGVWTQGGGFQPGYESVLRFDGKTYLRHPAIPSAGPSKERPAGDEVIRSTTDAVSLW